MERWAASTLRVLGIVVASLLLITSSLLMLLLTMCGLFKNGSDQAQAFGFLAAYLLILVGCIFAIIKLGKGLARSSDTGTPALPVALHEQLPLHPLTDSALQWLNYLRLAVIAEVFVSVASSILNSIQFHTTQVPSFPALLIRFLILCLIYQAPYFLLLVLLKNPPKRWVLSFAVALPCASILSSLYYLLVFGRFYARAPQAIGILLFLVIDVVTAALAWRLRARLRYNDENGSLIAAAIVCLVYTGVPHVLTPFLFR